MRVVIPRETKRSSDAGRGRERHAGEDAVITGGEVASLPVQQGGVQQAVQGGAGCGGVGAVGQVGGPSQAMASASTGEDRRDDRRQ